MKKRFLFAAVCITAVFLSIACGNAFGNKKKDSNQGNTSENTVSFESFSPRSVSVKNNTGERLVAFKGAIESASLISGVPAHASNHGLKKDPSLFSETGDFALLFLTEK